MFDNLIDIQSKIEDLVDLYHKLVFDDPNFYRKDEGYKYDAVGTFLNKFDPKSNNWSKMIQEALSNAGNLVQSRNYFPKQMLLECIEKDQEFVKNEFANLFKENKPIDKRIDNLLDNFKNKFQHEFSSKWKNLYIDHRFLSFFLAAQNPSKYFYIKSKDYGEYAKLIGYDLDLSNTKTKGKRYQKFLELAKITREVLKNNERFLEVHNRIVKDCNYKDPELSWGTYDFIFNVSRKERKTVFENKIQQIKKTDRIHEDIEEYYKDGSIKESIRNEISSKSKEQLLTEGKKFIPPTEAYIKKVGQYQVRKESRKQKEIVKRLNNYSCQICGFSFEYIGSDDQKRKYAQVDHIIDKSDNGTEEIDNLWVLCPNCHSKKTLGVITVDINNGKVFEDGKEISLHHNNHLSWYK